MAVVNELVLACRRWVSLDLGGVNFAEVPQGFHFDLAKELREFRSPVSYTYPKEEIENAFLTSLFATPQLTSLKLHSCSRENIMQLAPKFSWNFLVKLDLSLDSPWEFVAQAISKCTSVAHLSIRVTQPIKDISAFPENIILPKLQVLRMEYKSTDALALFPALKSFSLCVLEMEAGLFLSPAPPAALLERPFDLLASFLEHGRHTIQVFRLNVDAVHELDDSITNVLLSCRRGDILDVGHVIGGPRGWYPYELTDRLKAIAEVLENIPTSLPPFAIRSRAEANSMVVGWLDRSRITVQWQEWRPWIILDEQAEY